MKYAIIALFGSLVFPMVGNAQTPPAKSPEQQATESMLVQEMTAHRDWQAKALELQGQLDKALADNKTAQADKSAQKAP